mmetsp:Transcript_32611/g.86807  ORF Transcript_32611/g.86807 Transcript_32611/m.86807 type:complete len:210 (+) Transcript_32611:438-1067(+)
MAWAPASTVPPGAATAATPCALPAAASARRPRSDRATGRRRRRAAWHRTTRRGLRARPRRHAPQPQVLPTQCDSCPGATSRQPAGRPSATPRVRRLAPPREPCSGSASAGWRPSVSRASAKRRAEGWLGPSGEPSRSRHMPPDIAQMRCARCHAARARGCEAGRAARRWRRPSKPRRGAKLSAKPKPFCREVPPRRQRPIDSRQHRWQK